MSRDGLVTEAKAALSFKMQRHITDLLVRESAAMRAAERASKRLRCACGPLHWELQPLRTRNIFPFLIANHESPRLYRQAPFYYTCTLSQSRIFAQLELFELPVVAPVETSDLNKFDRVFSEQSFSIALTQIQDLWAVRKEVFELFAKSIQRTVDLVRLTVLQGEGSPGPGNDFWIYQGVREFPVSKRQWVSGYVYEANSAQGDKAQA